MNILLTLCEVAIQKSNLNPCVIEHIVLILCYSTSNYKETSTRLFTALMETEFNYFVVAFLLDLFEGAQYTAIKAKCLNKEAVLKKKVEPVYEYSHSLLTCSMSSKAREYFSLFYEDTPKELQRDKIVSASIERSEDKLISGAILLIGVKRF